MAGRRSFPFKQWHLFRGHAGEAGHQTLDHVQSVSWPETWDKWEHGQHLACLNTQISWKHPGTPTPPQRFFPVQGCDMKILKASESIKDVNHAPESSKMYNIPDPLTKKRQTKNETQRSEV